MVKIPCAAADDMAMKDELCVFVNLNLSWMIIVRWVRCFCLSLCELILMLLKSSMGMDCCSVGLSLLVVAFEELSQRAKDLKALAVDDSRAGLVVLLLGDPHLLEGGQRGQDGATDPDGVLPLRWRNDLDLDGRWGQGSDLLLHTISNTWWGIGISKGLTMVFRLNKSNNSPGYMVVPPDSTELAYRSLRMSTSHFMIEL